MRISDWSSDVCSSDLQHLRRPFQHLLEGGVARLDLGSVAARRRLERRGGGPAAGQLHIAPTGQALQLEGSDAVGAHRRANSEERRGGQACVRTGKTRWSPSPYKKNKQTAQPFK